MLFTPLWKRLLILAIVGWGIVATIPNLFYTRVEAHNDAIAAVEKAGGIATPEQQAAIDAWPSYLPSALVNLGLDLRGGAHLLAEVQVADVYAQRIDSLWPEVRDALRDVRDQVGAVRRMPSVPGVLRVSVGNADGMTVALAKVAALASPVVSLTGVGQKDLEVTADGQEIVVQLSQPERVATDDRTMQQSLEIIRRRVDAVGTREPTIQREGTDRILIQVPGLGSAAELKAIIGTTAKLTFNPVVGRTSDPAADPGARNSLLPSTDEKDVF
jgi:preprotein translocase subunit SecD